jgi:hypothetical protein
LWLWIYNFLGVKVATGGICAGHSAPFEMLSAQVFDRPSIMLWHGPRGSGKSFLSAADTHIESRFYPNSGSRILGGSLAQSRQIYEAIDALAVKGRGILGADSDTILSITKQEALYNNGSSVSILAASPTSVRGPHVANLKLDEVDEIDPGVREDSMGMVMAKNNRSPSLLMTSTWHRVAGPMASLVARGRAGEFPVHSYCAFEVLERCPEERSGKNLEKCPDCPIFKWCHQDMGSHSSDLPKAKRSNGHYTIDSLVQKVRAVSKRVFESDYLCLGPTAEGAWYRNTYDEDLHVTPDAEYNSALPYHLAIDPGVCTGAVWFQIRRDGYDEHEVNVFADYYAEDIGAEKNARAIIRRSEHFCGTGAGTSHVSMDPNCNQRTAIGPTIRGEYERVGCQGRGGIDYWPSGPGHHKTDGLNLIEALLMSADGKAHLKIHPRCLHLREAFKSYRRAMRDNQWMDYPEDPQHPGEDMIDALAGGLKLELPEGRRPKPMLREVRAGSVV